MTYKEIEDFIKTNKITKRNDLEETDTEVYKSFCRLSREEKDALIPYKGKYSNFNTFEDFDKFIKENNIASRSEFDSRFSRVYKLFFNSLTEEEKDLLLPKKWNYKYEFLNQRNQERIGVPPATHRVRSAFLSAPKIKRVHKLTPAPQPLTFLFPFLCKKLYHAI